MPTEDLKEIGIKGIYSLTEFINKVYVSGEWPQDFLRITMIPPQKKLNVMQCKDYKTISIPSHASNIIMKIFNRRHKKKNDEVLRRNEFGFIKEASNGCNRSNEKKT